MALDFTTSFIKLNNQYTIVGSAENVDENTVPKKGELYFLPANEEPLDANGEPIIPDERVCKIGDGVTAFANLPVIGVSSLGLETTSDAADITLAYNGRYKLNVGNKDIVFKMPAAIEVEEFTDTFQAADYTSGLKIATGNNTPDLYVPTGKTADTVALGDHDHTITASATDGIFNLTGTAGTNKVTYKLEPYTSRQTTAGKFDTSNSAPTGTTRLNWDGYLYATKFVGPLDGNASSASQLKFIKKLDIADNLDTLKTPGLYWWGNGTSAPTNNGANTLPFTNASVVEVSPIMNPDGTQYGVTQRMWRYGGSGYVAQRTIYGDNVLDWFTFETKDHSHDVNIAAAASTATNELTLVHGSKYTLSAGGQSFVFTMPSSGNTDYKASSCNTSSKIYLIGATSQGSSTSTGMTTYSHDTAYVGTDGCLYSGSKKVSVEPSTPKMTTSTSTSCPAFPSGSTYGTTFSRNYISNTTANNDNYLLHISSTGDLYVGLQTNTSTTPTWNTVATLSTSQALTNKTYNGYTLGAACAKGVADSTSAGAISSTGTNLVTERDVYYGLPYINNSHSYTSSTKIYAPTAGGTSGFVLVGNGTTSAPVWKQKLDIANGGTGQTTAFAARQALGVGYSTTGAKQQLTTTKLTCVAYGHYVLEVQLTFSGATVISYVPFVHPGTAGTLKVIVPSGTETANEVMNLCLTLSTTASQVSLSSVDVPALENAPSYSTKVYIW